MNRLIASSLVVVACVVTQPSPFADNLLARMQEPPKAPVNDDKHFVYADFERTDENKKPVSTRGGAIGLFPYSAPASKEATATGPELVRTNRDDPNHLLKFDYALFAPSDWTGVTLEIHGQPDVDGKMVPDDLSHYKFLLIECYVTGVPIVRLEILSQVRGKDPRTRPPQYTFKIKEGRNTYKIPLSGFSQPAWVTDERIDPKDILKNLTSIHVIPFCEGPCDTNRQGMVVLDNIVFEK